MHGAEVEMHNCEKFPEDWRVCINHGYHISRWNMKYSKNYIFIWLDKYEENSRVRYFVKKCVEYGHMAKSYKPWSLINRDAPLLSYHTMA